MARGKKPKKVKPDDGPEFRSVADAYVFPPVVPTGIIPLDAALGGGIMSGTMLELFGPSRGGKTAMAIEINRAFQAAGGPPRSAKDRRGWWQVVGEFFDAALFERVGGDPRLLDYNCDLETTVEAWFRRLRRWCLKHAVDRAPKAATLDSLAMLKTEGEVKAGLLDSSYDDRAKMIYRGLRDVAGVLSRTGTTLILINQVRQKRGVFFGSNETTPGGWGPEFFATQRLRLSQGTFKKGKKSIIRDGRDVAIGHRVQVRVDKNRLIPAEGQGVELAWMFATGFDPVAGSLRLLADNGLIEDRTKGSEDGVEAFEWGGKRIRDEEAFVDEHPELLIEIYRAFRPESARNGSRA